MALPGTNKSLVLGLDVSSVENAVALAIAGDPAAACPSLAGASVPGLDLLAACLRTVGGAGFLARDGATWYRQPLRLDVVAELSIPIPGFSLGEVTLVCDIEVQFLLTPAVAPGPPWGVALTLSYDATAPPDDERLAVACNTLPEPFRGQVEQAVAGVLHAVLGNVSSTTTLAAGSALPTRTPLGPPGAVVASSNGAGSTLLLGVAVAGDGGASAGAFPPAYDGTSFPSVTEWGVEIDEDVVLAELRATVPAPAIVTAISLVPGLLGFTVAGAGAPVLFWSGDTVPTTVPGVGGTQPVDAGDRADMAAQAPDHPVWFVQPLTLTPVVGLAFPLPAYAFGHVVISADGQGGVTAQPRIDRVRCLGFDLSAVSVPDPAAIALPGSATFPVIEVGFDAQRLRLLGADASPVWGGPPELDVPPAVALSNLTGVCQPRLSLGGNDEAVTERVWLRNVGGSPLWLCGLALEQTGDDFTLEPVGFALGDLPFALAPTEAVAVDVVYDPDQPGTGQATLVVTSNDCDAPVNRIALDAEQASEATVAGARELCVDPPEHIPPQDWFDDLGGFHAALGDEVQPADGGLTILEVFLTGLGDDALVAPARGGELAAVAQPLAGGWRLALPLGSDGEPGLVVAAHGWERAPHAQAHLSDAPEVGRLEHDGRASALAADGPLLAALFEDELVLGVVDSGLGVRRAGALRVKGALDVGLAGAAAWARTADELVLLDLADPGRPREVARAALPADADVRPTETGFVALRDERVEVHAVAGRTLRLVAAQRFDARVEGFVPGAGGGLFVDGKGATRVHALDARGLAAGRRLERAALPAPLLRRAAEPAAPRLWLDAGGALLDGVTTRSGVAVRARRPAKARLSHAGLVHFLGGGAAAGREAPPLVARR